MSRDDRLFPLSPLGRGWVRGWCRKKRPPDCCPASAPSPQHWSAGLPRPNPRGAEGALGLILASIAAALLPSAAIAAPDRVVSINLCTDQFLVLLADRDAVTSVSFLAADDELSYVADRVDGLPVNHGLAEEVLALKPDLVLAGEYGAGPTVRLLKALDLPVVEIGLADDFASIAKQTRAVAAALGVPERAEELLDRMRSALAAAAPNGPDRPDALIYQANGFTAGAGTLADAVLAAAGFDNVAAEAGLVGYGYLPLERLIAAAPDVVIIDRELADAPSLAHELLRHPALDRLNTRMPVAAVPDGTLACGGPYTAEAATALGKVRDGLLSEDAP